MMVCSLRAAFTLEARPLGNQYLYNLKNVIIDTSAPRTSAFTSLLFKQSSEGRITLKSEWTLVEKALSPGPKINASISKNVEELISFV